MKAGKICLIVLLIACIWFASCNHAVSNEPERKKTTSFQYTPSVIIYGEDKPAMKIIQDEEVNPPQGMVLIPGGYVHLGSDNATPDEQPRVWAKVKSFFMDADEVSVSQFRQFINATGYKTEAEKFGNSGVFTIDGKNLWQLKDGANWEYPRGKDFPKAADHHPVTQVSWNDAMAYAKWAGKRLPSEIEWEHAARNAENSETRYSWGEEAKANGKWLLNFFQGEFPSENLKEDGYEFTAPVGSFVRSSLGLADMSGNVWEWCADSKISYENLSQGKFETTGNEKAMRGGSFLCETNTCHGYRVSARAFTTAETSLMHIGFRCVKDISN